MEDYGSIFHQESFGTEDSAAHSRLQEQPFQLVGDTPYKPYTLQGVIT